MKLAFRQSMVLDVIVINTVALSTTHYKWFCGP
jgi:hypothetical protein